ncbi:anti-sigma factor [Streptomyces sp. TRM70350]|uniref:anti-sigma factor family protein n=1 Tax=Streptomyces sp. TRM70350 TaxID=2856165 RepID=UPI001C49049B|nr:zf-HC2 domain-containing protein [Streptomyces sp. TRM70350]MBV7697381.1 zf-HC2 domain-containing protein [Streptomyces sp. TRM70350]
MAAECQEKYRHVRLRGWIEAYVDNQLTGTRRARVAAHLAACWACSGTAETLHLVKHSLRRAPRRTPTLSELRLRRFASRLTHTGAARPTRQVERRPRGADLRFHGDTGGDTR